MKRVHKSVEEMIGESNQGDGRLCRGAGILAIAAKTIIVRSTVAAQKRVRTQLPAGVCFPSVFSCYAGRFRKVGGPAPAPDEP